MTKSLLQSAGALLVLASLGRASAGIDSVNGGLIDVHGALGSELTIVGTDFGGTTGAAKPKVFIEFDGKLYALKVTEFDDTHIVATIKKGALGSHVLHVRPKGTAAEEDFLFGASIVLEAPAIDQILDENQTGEIDEASPGLPFVLTGEFFGVKKFKIFIGGKKAKVLTWAMDEILLEMPKKLSNGLWDIELLTKIGTDADEQIVMIDSLVKVGKVKVTLTLGTGPSAQTLSFKPIPTATSEDYIAFGGTTTSFPLKTFGLVAFYDGQVPAQLNSEDHALMTATFTLTEKGPDIFTPGAISNWFIVPGTAGLTVNITASGGGQVGGDFSGDLPLLVGTGAPFGNPLHIEGTFIYEE